MLQGILLLKTKKKRKNLQGWQEKQVLSIFELPAKGKSCGVILDEFLNAHDMIILAAPLTFVWRNIVRLVCISKFCSSRTLEQPMEGFGWFDLLEDEQKLSMGGMLALLKYPFYPLFNFDNGMNLISESLTILTSAQLLVVFAFAHIFWRYFIFAGFWPILEHEMTRPTITRWHEERRMPKPEQRTEGHDD